MKSLIMILTAGLILAGTAHASSLEDVVDGQTALTCDLYQQLSLDPGNVFFSPASISLILGLVRGGALGETAQEMTAALHFPDNVKALHSGNLDLQKSLDLESELASLAVANRLWPDQRLPLRDSFLNLSLSNYLARPEALDFAGNPAGATGRINAWIADQTQQMIPELLQPGDITPATLLVLTNAIYFKGTWQYQFDPKLTVNQSFRVDPQTTVEAPFMVQKGALPYAGFPGAQVVELPYAGTDLAMLIVLPDQVDGLARIEAELSADWIRRWTGNLQPVSLQLILPRFELDVRKKLRENLEALGMKTAFTAAAEF